MADATVIVATVDVADASRCHDSHDNATETNKERNENKKDDYDSNAETTAKSMSTHSNEYQLGYIIMRTTIRPIMLLSKTLCILL